MDFKNSDIANGLDVTSLMGADASASLEGAALLKMALQSGNIMPLTADGQLVLPAGVGLDDIKVVGRDLVIQMPDGTQMIVPDGAIIVPQIVVDGVAIPALNFAGPCHKFRVWAGIMGKKETYYVTTQRACDPG